MLRLTVYLLIVSCLRGQTADPFATVRRLQYTNAYALALPILDSCLKAGHVTDSTLYYKSFNLLKMEKLEDSRACCDLLIKNHPSFREAYYLSGLLWFSDENYGRSIEEFNQVLKEDPNHFKAHYNRSVAFGMLKEYQLAIDDLTQCLLIDPGSGTAHYSRAYWHEYAGNLAEAAKDYEETIRIDRKNFDAYIGLAFIYQRQHDTARACATIQKAVDAGSQIAEDVKSNYCR